MPKKIRIPYFIRLKWSLLYFYKQIIGSKRLGQRVFGVGAAKTGTHSLGQMFDDKVSSAHELDIERLIYMHLERVRSGNNDDIRRFLQHRDTVRELKIDASHINIYLLDDFEILFPNSLYVMTIRHPVDWLRSFIDDSMRAEASDAFKVFRQYRFYTSQKHPQEEQPLADLGLFTINSYLKYWSYAIETVTEKISNERLLILHTEQLGDRSKEIADFCGIDYSIIDDDRSKAYVNSKRFRVLSELPPGYLDNKVQEICGHLLQRHFTKNIND